MTREKLLTYIENPSALNEATLPELKELTREYPYFQTAALLYLKNLKSVDDLSYTVELKRTALLVADRTRLEEVMEADKPSDSKVEALTEVTSGVEFILKEEPADAGAPRLQHADLIDRFISENPHIKPVGSDTVVEEPPVPVDEENVTDSVFTESLAKIYIKQKQYAKAIRIFEKLNLKYPEKSSYFADQIKFLKKIIENS